MTNLTRRSILRNSVGLVAAGALAPEQAIDKAFKRAEAVFAKYPIAQA